MSPEHASTARYARVAFHLPSRSEMFAGAQRLFYYRCCARVSGRPEVRRAWYRQPGGKRIRENASLRKRVSLLPSPPRVLPAELILRPAQTMVYGAKICEVAASRCTATTHCLPDAYVFIHEGLGVLHKVDGKGKHGAGGVNQNIKGQAGWALGNVSSCVG